jgi:acyl-[acyl carrier protein]--UDP-N-acetylglucosamine O-acyltransferase
MVSRGPSSDLHDLDPVRLRALQALSFVVLGAYRAVLGERLVLAEGVVANHRLLIKGPGTVVVGAGANLFAFGIGRHTRLVTRRRQACIRVGANARLNGAELQADTLIEVGPGCIIGQAHLIDTDMHSLDRNRRTDRSATVRSEPIVLERDVWVARGAAILPGVRVGEGSVVGYGSVVTSDVPAGVVVAGNPARVVKSLE